MMSLRGRHNYKKSPRKRLTRKTRYGFLKRRTKSKYFQEEDREELRLWKRWRRVQAHKKILERRDRAYAEQARRGQKESVFMFRKGTFPNRASYEPLPIVIYNRSQVITQKYCNRTVSIYNGFLYFNFKVTSEAIGSKFGEASPTKQWRPGMTHTKRQKSKKSQKEKGTSKTKAAKGVKPIVKKAKK